MPRKSRLIIFTTDPVFSCIRPACVRDPLLHKPSPAGARPCGGGTSVVAFDIYFFPFSRDSSTKVASTRAGPVLHRTGNNTRSRGDHGRIIYVYLPNIMYIRIRRTNGRESIYGLRWFGHSSSYIHVHFTSIYMYYSYRVYAYLYFIDKEIVCVQVQCVSACNDDNMSARPMGSRTCLIIRSYGNYVRAHTHTLCRLAYTTDP